jgi:DNA helicase-2/ATP-dependent DNA helicase PcrA
VNRLTLAVAGGRKTQGIVDECERAGPGERILVLTYTLANQGELRARVASRSGIQASVTVTGWFSFLMGHFVRPYLPMVYPGRRLAGLNFDGDPGRVAGARRHLDPDGRAYRIHLARLAVLANASSGGAAVDRLSRMYDRILVDEVQDLNGYDLEVLQLLLDSPTPLRLVGDVRQALLATNQREPKNAKYKGTSIKAWFDERAAEGRLHIEHAASTWRCSQQIADLADSLFGAEWGFSPTKSMSDDRVDHEGIFTVEPAAVLAYFEEFVPLCMRHSASSARSIDLPFVNIGKAKGRTSDHVLVAPTTPMLEFLRSGRALETFGACSLYVAVTRARFSVAFITDAKTRLPKWSPMPVP